DVSGDALVGAYRTGNNAGAAYLFNSSGSLTHTYAAPSGSGQTGLGNAVAIDTAGDVLVGAIRTNVGRGAADLYGPSGNPVQPFTEPVAPTTALGFSGALGGGDALIGAALQTGAAYLYGIPAAVSAQFGNNLVATVGTAFGTLLQAQVFDAQGNPV